MRTPEDHIQEVLNRVKEDYIFKTYKIKSWTSAENFLEQFALKSGKLLKVRFWKIWCVHHVRIIDIDYLICLCMCNVDFAKLIFSDICDTVNREVKQISAQLPK